MKKFLKIAGLVIGVLIALFVVLAVALTLLFDPNDYKDKISQTVKDKTGRDLRIEGKLGWSFFPWIGIETGRLELSNAPGFGKEPFAQIDRAGAQVALLPLLRKIVVIDTVLLDGLKLNLARNAAGKTNWDDLTAPSKREAAADKTVPGEEPGIGAIGVNKIDVRKADVSWKDEKTGARYAVHNLDLKTGKILVGRPADVKLSFDLESGQPPIRTRVEMTSRVTLDIGDQTLEVADLSLAVGDLRLSANVKGNKIFDAPAFSGSLEIAAFSPRALMNQFGVQYETADKNALGKLALKTAFAASTENAELKDLSLNLDDSRLTGALAVRNFAQPAYKFELAVDQIDIDRYLPASAEAPAAPKATPATAAVAIPMSLLRSLALQGQLRIQNLKAFNLRSTDATVQVAASNGLITLGPNQAKLYNGKYAGKTTLDARGKTPQFAIDESVTGVELAPALKDALQFDKFTGVADLNAKVTAQGLDAEQIKQTLNGSASFAVQKGSIKGVDLKKMTDTIGAAIKDESYKKLTEIKPQPGDETTFSQLNGTAQIKNGIVENNDLKIQSPNLLNVTGKGTANLPQATLNYRVALGNYALIISGPFSKLSYKPDFSGVIKGKVEEKKTEIKEKAKEELKQKYKDKLKFLR